MPILTWPFVLFGLTALPGVAAIYMLRTRSKRHVVSSLMLWTDQRRARAGGLKFQRIQTPLLLILELLIVTLLVLAAAGPKIPTARNRRPLVIVLDDSFSMRAGGENSPQALARQAIATELETGRHNPVQFVLASDRPVALGRPAWNIPLALATLENWTCQSSTADLQAAIMLATSIAQAGDQTSKARILVVTDQKPAINPEPGDVRWLAFGQARANIAFTAAVRAERNKTQQCLIELTNFAESPQSAKITINGLEAPQQQTVTIPAGATHAIRLNVPDPKSTVHAVLADDDLTADNSLILLPQPQRIVRVDLSAAGKTMRDALTRALTASGQALLTDQRPTLQITDQMSASTTGPETWLVQFVAEAQGEAYVGPFVVDRSHPLTDGLSLAGQIWGAGKTARPHGRTIVAAGNIPLITERIRPGGRREIRVRLRPDISTLQDSANWPVLVSNMLEYRAAALAGMEQTNVRLGVRARVALDNPAQNITVTDPSGDQSKSPVADRSASIIARSPGVYTVNAGPAEYRFAANTLAPAESDLRDRTSGDWGDWLADRAVAVEYTSISWVLLLAALAMLAAHSVIVSPGARGARA
jgi:hypothetical protein